MGRLSKIERRKIGGGGGGKGFQEVQVTYDIKLHSSCEIEYLVETHVCIMYTDFYTK